jgi:heme ABC exporter ATP-binding subunit CcmA
VNEIITVDNLSKKFGRKKVLIDLDLSVSKGEFLTIFGPNGAGKTTLIKIISTLARPTAGEIKVDGHDINEEPLEVRGALGVISHDLYLYDELTAEENLRFYGKMYSYPADRLNERIVKLLEEIGLQLRMKDRVGTFSRGMKQRLSIARAILHKPKILLLDEPYTGLDQHATGILTKILKRLHTQDRTIIMTTHNLEMGFELCDRAAILAKGTIVFQKSKHELDVKKFKKIYLEKVG